MRQTFVSHGTQMTDDALQLTVACLAYLEEGSHGYKHHSSVWMTRVDGFLSSLRFLSI